MGLTIQVPPGYSDLDDAVLVVGQPALGIDLAKIYDNAVFGMTRPEIFVYGPFENKEVVPIPISPIDGYQYKRSELLYLWAVQNSVDKSTGWITAHDSLWFCEWGVDQTTGLVSSNEWYRRSGKHYDGVHTFDGTLTVWVVAQRLQADLVMASSPSYSAVSSGWIGTDQPYSQQLAQGLNDDSKFAVVNKEAFYLGEYSDGQTVTMPTSPCDGYSYSSGECKFTFSWRWTTDGTAAHVTEPPLTYGQLGPIQASVDSAGVVSISISYVDDNNNLNAYSEGRIAVFAFCQRSGTPGSVSPAANSFAEISFNQFMPGQALEYTTLQQMLANTLQALLEVEYFGPTSYKHADVIPTPTSPIDGFAYARTDLTYVWSFSDTTNAGGSDLRMASFGGAIDQTTGTVHCYGFRLPPGGGYVALDQSKPRISVIVVARRNAQLPTSITSSSTDPQQDFSLGGNQVADIPTLSGVGYDVFAGDNSTTVFTLTAAPLGGFAFVFWSGAVVVPADYIISGATFTTAFKDQDGNAVPAQNGDNIYVVYFN